MKKWWIALLVCLLVLPCARAEETKEYMTYDELPSNYRAFFDAAQYADASFYVYPDYDRMQDYYREKGYLQMTRYPVVSLRGDEVRVHLFDISDGVSLLAESQTPMRLPAGYALEGPLYDTNGVFANQGWDYAYRESLNLYFLSGTSPCWVIQLDFENADPDDPTAFSLFSCDMQFNPERRIGKQLYDNLIYHFNGDNMTVSCSYQEGEGGRVSFDLPAQVNRDLWTFDPSALPEDPLLFFRQSARVETGKHGNGGRLILRDAPDRSGKVLSRIDNGAAIRYIDRADGWAVVLYKDQVGYARAESIEGSHLY